MIPEEKSIKRSAHPEGIIEMEQQEEDEEEAPIDKKQLYFGKKILDEWMPDILSWSAEGLSLAKVAKKVLEKYDTKVTPGGIRLAMNRAKAERSQISQAVVQSEIGKYIVNDLDILTSKKQELVELAAQFKDKEDWKNYFSSVDRIKEYSKMLFDLSGVHEQQRNDDAINAKEDLMDLFNRFQFGSRQ